MNDSNATRNNYYGEYLLSLQRYITEVSKIFAPIRCLNVLLILVFSTLWALYLIPKLWKDYRNEKITSKLRNNQPEYLWINKMENFKSNRIKNTFLLCVCMSEIGVTISIVFGITLWISSFIFIGVENRVKYWLQNPSFLSY